MRFPEFSGEWHSIILNDLCSLITKGTTPKEFSKGDVNFVKIESLNGIYILKENCATITSEIHNNELRRSILEQDDILFAIAGATVGKIGIVTNDILPANTNQALAIIRLKEKSQKDFLLFVLGSATMKKYIFQSMSVGAQPNLSLAQINNFKFNTPTLPEQTKIAALLSVITDRINTQSKIIEHQESLMKGLIRQIFSQQLRFRDENGNDFSEWKKKRLGEIAEIVGGGTPETTKPEYWNGNFNWFTPTEIKQKYIEESNRKVTALGIQKSSAKILPKNTLLFTSRATIGDVGITKVECSTNQGFQSFLPNEKYETEFLYYWLKAHKKKFIRKSSGSTFIEISKGEMQKIRIQIPSIQEQSKIAKFLSSFDERLEKEKQILTHYKQQKKHLLQNLFV
ncbi:restriction endonuclease subunit S [Carboxylicivirga linearis]|uniref:Restriction endonuclease subunit S n=1 Tax=Carboxylicivirga linearis TaxID=1628157 RepID=A0ABS5K188_9BACT|nr:restriction endonuclease subunit S [Carboxylicivirga linearis]MBS2100937.1 restriction endonuclease subunit S [Carboxylicivirga linearis]